MAFIDDIKASVFCKCSNIRIIQVWTAFHTTSELEIIRLLLVFLQIFEKGRPSVNLMVLIHKVDASRYENKTDN